MGTPLTELFPFIRYEVLRTNDETSLPSADLELAIRHIVNLGFTGFSVVDVAGTLEVQPVLLQNEKYLLILQVALSILVPEDAFSYKTPSFSKTIEGIPGLEDQKEDLRRRIAELESGSPVAVQSSDELGHFYNRATRFQDSLSKAQSEG